MIWFEYKFNNPIQILNDTKVLLDFWINEIIILISILSIFFMCLFFSIPYFKILIEYNIEKFEKNKKKKLINKIIIQKNIEWEIEKELNLK